MIKRHINHGVINRQICRPEPRLIDKFKGFPSVVVYEALNGQGAMCHDIKPVKGGMSCVGPACTVQSTPGDALFVTIACDVAEPGDVVVVDNGCYYEGNSIGDGMAKYFFERTRIAGFVNDGAVRDVEGIIEVGLPTWGTSVSVKLIGSDFFGAVNIRIVCGGQVVNPGDLIVADDDAVVVVPFARVADVADRCEALLELDMKLRSRIRAGENLSSLVEWYNAGRKEIGDKYEWKQ